MTFDMELKLPKLQNLAGHVGECKGAKDAMKKVEPTSEEQRKVQSRWRHT